MTQLWALHDSRDSSPTMVTPEEAANLNKDGWGIFHTVNEHEGRRLVSNLTRINYWFCEIDGGSKAYHLKRLENAPLIPTRVVESARGYHAYFKAKDAGLERWKRIVRWGLCPYFDADPKATDPLRLLRAPGYLHCKSENRFEVQEVWHCPWYEYTEEQMLEAFPSREPARPVVERVGEESAWHVDARVGLVALNGHPAMGGEHFELKPTSGGKYNIIRTIPTRKDTGCFVDAEGMIGGNHLGSTLGSWLKWYGSSRDEILAAIAEVKREQA